MWCTTIWRTTGQIRAVQPHKIRCRMFSAALDTDSGADHRSRIPGQYRGPANREPRQSAAHVETVEAKPKNPLLGL